MPEQQKTGKGGTRKVGRNKLRCGKYKMTGRREKNKKRNIAKDLKLKAKKKMEKEGEE